MDMQLFGKRLRDVRISRNVSARELAEATKTYPTTIYRYENAEFKSIKESRLEAIANYLSVNKDYLVGNTDDPYSVTSLEFLSKKKEKIEIHSIISLTKQLIKQDNITLDGKPINEVNLDNLIETMEVALEMLKRKNK